MDRELLEKVKRHDISFHEIDKILDTNASIELRRTAISQLTGTKFDHISNYSMDVEVATKRNIENMIGAIQVPLGVAGPLRVNGEYANGEYYIPWRLQKEHSLQAQTGEAPSSQHPVAQMSGYSRMNDKSTSF